MKKKNKRRKRERILGVEVYTPKEAYDKGLIQLYHWLSDSELNWLISEMNRILKNPKRQAILVRYGDMYSVFVDDIAKRESEGI